MMLGMQDPRVPDRAERLIRFVCGAIFGAGFGIGLSLLVFNLSARGVCALALAFAALCGLLAMQRGDRFWWELRSWLEWL